MINMLLECILVHGDDHDHWHDMCAYAGITPPLRVDYLELELNV